MGDVEGALREFPRTIEASAPTGMVLLEIAAEAFAAETLAEAGRAGEALEHVQRCRNLIGGTCFAYFESELRVVEAYVARQKGDMVHCHVLLADAFALASSDPYAHHWSRCPSGASRHRNSHSGSVSFPGSAACPTTVGRSER